MIKAKKFNFKSALPAISEEAFRTHYDCHYLKYIDNVNYLLPKYGSNFSVKQILEHCGVESNLHNQASQIGNHEFFFEQFTGESSKPSKLLLQAILDSGYESFHEFCEEIVSVGKTVFGSGYIGVVQRFGSIRVITTLNAQNFLSSEYSHPILTIDLWEHAHYVDYKADKDAYIRNILASIDGQIIENRLCEK